MPRDNWTHWGFWTKVLMSGSTKEQEYARQKMDEWFVKDQRKNIKWPLSQPEYESVEIKKGQ